MPESRSESRRLVRKFFRSVSFLILAGCGAVALVGLAILFTLTRDLPDVQSLREFRHLPTTQVFADDGTRIGEFSNERRYPVRYDDVPEHVVKAFIAAEDANFFRHTGIDYGGIARAVVSNLLKGKYAQGASTITQQVARALLLTSRKKELTRKVKEVILARRMEKELTKQEIMALYLNEIFLGHGAYGLGAAAYNYFHKNVADLTIAEGAMLAGLPQRPSDWDPFKGPHQAKRRQAYVLKQMVNEHFITEEQSHKAYEEPLHLYALQEVNETVAPYVTQYVYKYLEERYGAERIYSDGFRVYTSIQLPLQKEAERVLAKGVRVVDKRMGWRGPIRHLASASEVQNFEEQTHEGIIEDLSPVRILPANVDPVTRKLQYDLSEFQKPNSPYFGETPLKAGTLYSAVITFVDDTKAMARVGYTDVVLPWTQVQWAAGQDLKIKKTGQILKSGDVVDIQVTKIDKGLQYVEAALEQTPEITGALLSFEVESGMVRSMVGGTDFKRSQFNVALQGKRQVGSLFKPVIYAAAMDAGFSPASIVTDSPIIFKYEGTLDADNTGESWRPKNYSGRFEGDIPLRLALVRSMNIPTVKLLDAISIGYLISYARRMGITSPLQRDLSIALGSWSSSLEELTRVFSVFPRLGRPVGLVYIKKITNIAGDILEETNSVSGSPSPVNAEVAKTEDPSNTSPPLTETHHPSLLPELPEGLVLSPQTAFVMTDMLKGVIRDGGGTGTAAGGVKGAIAGKTGTSNDHRDAWFVGYSPKVMTGVWVGYEKDKPLDPGETGGRAAAPIWSEFMQAAVKEYPSGDFSIPEGIVFAYIDRETGRLAPYGDPKRVRVAFKEGTVPNERGDNLARVGEVGSRSTSAQPEGGNQPPAPPPSNESTADFLRRGYQD